MGIHTFVGAEVSATSGNYDSGVAAVSAQNGSKYVAGIIIEC